MQLIRETIRLFAEHLSERPQIQIDGSLFNRIQEVERSVATIV
jgi:hypothetical protein